MQIADYLLSNGEDRLAAFNRRVQRYLLWSAYRNTAAMIVVMRFLIFGVVTVTTWYCMTWFNQARIDLMNDMATVGWSPKGTPIEGLELVASLIAIILLTGVFIRDEIHIHHERDVIEYAIMTDQQERAYITTRLLCLLCALLFSLSWVVWMASDNVGVGLYTLIAWTRMFAPLGLMFGGAALYLHVEDKLGSDKWKTRII